VSKEIEAGKPRWDKAREAARRLIDGYHITVPPVDVYRIAERCGLEWRRIGNFRDSVDGLIMPVHGRVIAFINKKKPRTRQRFTLAHELYHFHTLGQQLVLEDSSQIGRLDERHISKAGRDPIEVEADAFAADLLIPPSLLKKYVNRDYTVKFVSELFYVSPAAAEINLKLYPDHRL
jgi:Zn-dependent peptidase ImmA (M78 family)